MTTKRSFTVRVPLEFYLDLATLAERDNMDVNAKVNQLLKMGMGEHQNMDELVRSLLINHQPVNSKFAIPLNESVSQ